MTVKFEGNKFALQVISKGEFVDNGTGNGSSYLVEAITIRLNHIALNAWILSDCMNCRECYEEGKKGLAQWEAHKAKQAGKRETWKAQVLKALEIEINPDKESVCITQSQAEVFTVVHIKKIA
ncbi:MULTISPECIES: hypothetical protein [unclassified Dehalobacter]|uniref:hypothetical protein n=1 Tax=unclassified Dehalobacter TaxID=2635733 RepID=UPI00104A9553|nr:MULTISPECIES: hypothetical protein [unclassified Dehalobacter]TCX51908.1 hypothetical protein C1I36_06200 [Dehalobacter sp. 14DCB1]TCX52968.1 hypothetical protein C1I38_07880 [Dehalobacter sp. 12DCB1]